MCAPKLFRPTPQNCFTSLRQSFGAKKAEKTDGKHDEVEEDDDREPSCNDDDADNGRGDAADDAEVLMTRRR